jgi:hypothetical protein
MHFEPLKARRIGSFNLIQDIPVIQVNPCERDNDARILPGSISDGVPIGTAADEARHCSVPTVNAHEIF